MKVLLAGGLTALLLTTAAYAAPPSVNPEPMDIEADTMATIGREKAKQRRGMYNKDSDSKSSSGSGECGNININSNETKSNSGIKDMFGKKSTTIITGPVINMANCK